MTEKWRIDEWTGRSSNPIPMSGDEITQAVVWLRKNNYPVPEDCLGDSCPALRPTCNMGICYVAIRLCGDF